MAPMFRWLLKIHLGENPDDMSSVRVLGKRCNIVHRTSAPLSAVGLHGLHQRSLATKGLVKEWSRSPLRGDRGHPT